MKTVSIYCRHSDCMALANKSHLCSSCLERFVHQLGDGRWMCASWSTRNQQWTSSDLPKRLAKAQTGYCYTYGRSLQALVNEGIKTYPTRAACIRASFK